MSTYRQSPIFSLVTKKIYKFFFFFFSLSPTPGDQVPCGRTFIRHGTIAYMDRVRLNHSPVFEWLGCVITILMLHNCLSYALPFEYRTLKSPVFRRIRYSGVRYSDGYCIQLMATYNINVNYVVYILKCPCCKISLLPVR